MSMITTIAIALLALAIIGNSVAIFFIGKKTEKVEMEGVSHRAKTGMHVEDKINELQPLIDKYKKERKQNHWKQYNDWKRLYESKHGRCAQCHGEDLEIKTDYKYDRTRPAVFIEHCIEYPKSAKYKCKACGEVISTWEFKEDE